MQSKVYLYLLTSIITLLYHGIPLSCIYLFKRPINSTHSSKLISSSNVSIAFAQSLETCFNILFNTFFIFQIVLVCTDQTFPFWTININFIINFFFTRIACNCTICIEMIWIWFVFIWFWFVWTWIVIVVIVSNISDFVVVTGNFAAFGSKTLHFSGNCLSLREWWTYKLFLNPVQSHWSWSHRINNVSPGVSSNGFSSYRIPFTFPFALLLVIVFDRRHWRHRWLIVGR